MMAARRVSDRLIDRLPPVRGRLTADAPLAPITWFRAGGTAEIMFRPADESDLAEFLVAKPRDVPVTVLGVASNLLVRDGGIPGIVIRLGRAFVAMTTDGNTAAAANIGGMEFFFGIPGTIGGALRMNAGAYGRDIKAVLRRVVALDGRGRRHEVAAAMLGLDYRTCAAPADWIFIAAEFAGAAGDPAAIGQRMDEIQAAREASQPVRARTGGSTFANPPGHKAWELIDRAGCRGLTRGGAQVSEKHANFLINTGAATAADLEGLGEEVRRRVFENSGIILEWEIKRVGRPLPGISEAVS